MRSLGGGPQEVLAAHRSSKCTEEENAIQEASVGQGRASWKQIMKDPGCKVKGLRFHCRGMVTVEVFQHWGI